MRQITKYAYANAKIRAMLSRLLDPLFLDSLMEARDFAACVDLLKKTQYAAIFEKVDRNDPDIRRLEDELTAFDEAVFRKVSSPLFSPEKEFVMLLLESHEIEALKVALRLWFNKPQGIDPADFLPSRKILNDIDYAKIAQGQNIEEIIFLLAETPYFRALARGREKFKAKNSLFYLEASLDVDYYERVFSAVSRFSPSDQRLAKRILGIEIDIENIGWLVRLRKYYNLGLGDMLDWVIPGGSRINKDTVRECYSADGLGKILESCALGPYAKIKDLTEQNIFFLESLLYQFLLREVKRALAGFPFSIGTVMGYLILKRRETKNLISILNGKKMGWKKDELSALISL
jgi:V/A-type H+-transporting ATPase subunit C